MHTKLTVVGAGVVGASIALRAADAGHHVTLLDPRPRSGASWVAGGMLAPVTEAWPGEEELLELGADSLRRWPGFAASLTERGHDPGLRTEGTLVAAVDPADKAEVDKVAEFLGSLGRAVHRLSGRELRSLEPAIGPSVRSGLSVPGDLAVDNRKLVDALLGVLADLGIKPRSAEATAVRPGEVECSDGSRVESDAVVIAAGAWSGALHPGLRELVRPVKGEILRLRARPGSLPPPSRTVRGLVEGRPVYLVPRDERGLVIGATQYEAGFEPGPRVSGVRDLLADAERLLPGVGDYELVEATASVRPGTPDNLPVVRWLEPGVLAATGHGRNGMLLAPGTADTVAELLGQEGSRQ
ncbi:MAG TPA: glycine oxidase ThiO [Pseudonocardiaceae bacterium]|jgi:glycine oxidase|nr:glycine oxidase ThiO [Pseudonocardiaceae bacterium]